MAEDKTLETTEKKVEAKPTEPKAEPKKVEVSKDKLDEILNLVKDQAKKLEIQEKKISDLETGEQKPRIMKKIKEHYVILRKHEGKIVKGFENGVYREFDERNKEWVLYVDLVLDGGNVVKKIAYLDFISNAERVKAKIVKRDKEEKETVEAYINKKEPVGEFGTLISDVVVPVESIVEEYTFEVELEDGEKLQLNERAINI